VRQQREPTLHALACLPFDPFACLSFCLPSEPPFCCVLQQ
jgi:hypothetical protein